MQAKAPASFNSASQGFENLPRPIPTRPTTAGRSSKTLSTEIVEKPRTGDPDTGLEDNWRVIVLNDNHNTFDGVAAALSRVIPGVSLEDGYKLANNIHNNGQAVVWAGPKEPAELYWEQLKEAGLTMAPLEQG
jgi:ATP-dependent Clp protease adaptor protein ClpS